MAERDLELRRGLSALPDLELRTTQFADYATDKCCIVKTGFAGCSPRYNEIKRI